MPLATVVKVLRVWRYPVLMASNWSISIPLSAPSHSRLPDGHNHPNSISTDPQGTTAMGQSRRPTPTADGSSTYFPTDSGTSATLVKARRQISICETFPNSTRSRVRLIRWTAYRMDAKYGLGRATRRRDGGDRRRPEGLSFIGWTIGTVAF